MANLPIGTTTKSFILTNDTTFADFRKHFLDKSDNMIKLAYTTNQLLNRDQQDNNKNDTQVIIDQLIMSRTLVESMKLRATLVAPMKAGKSTITNGILGENILPTRNTAMTVIPTEVVLKVSKINTMHESEQTKLFLPPELIKQLTIMKDAVQTCLHSNSKKLDDLTKQLPLHPHLIQLAQTLYNGSSSLFNEITVGKEAIRALLEFANDVIRLYEYLMPTNSLAEIQRLSQNLPRIIVPYRSLGNETVINESLGNLVIVDTPGPNEDTTTNFLKEVLVQELRKASVILVVLDFTALNTQADKLVQAEVMKIRHSIDNNNETLFALVNKCDQRRQGDMTPDEVRTFVHNKFQIGNDTTQDGNRVFEIQAIRALLAKQFRMELNNTNEIQNIQYENLPSGQDFLTEAYGATYDDTNPPSLQKIKSDIVKVWQKSGFEEFLTNVVDKLIERAAPQILKDALIKYNRGIHELRESLAVRERLLEADVTKLQSQIQALNGDFIQFNNIIKEERNALQREEQDMIANVKKVFTEVCFKTNIQFKALLNRCLKSDEQTSTPEINIGENLYAAAQSVLSRNIGMILYHTLDGIRQMLERYRNSDDSLTFDSEVEGQQFIAYMKRQTQNIPENALLIIRSAVEEACSAACQHLNTRLHKATQKIIVNAQIRLSDTFNIELQKPPEFDLKFSEPTEDAIQMNKTYRPWWLLGLVNISYNEGYQEGTKYHFKKESVKMYCRNLLEASMNSIETELHKYLKEKLQQTFKQHVKQLQNQLIKYQKYLIQSVVDQKQSIEEKAKFKKELSDLRRQLEIELETITEIEAYL